MSLFADIYKKNIRALGYNTLTKITKKWSLISFHNLRNMDHDKEQEHYINATYNLEHLQDVYMYQSPFWYWDWVSHIMLEFVFKEWKSSKKTDSLMLSVEARRKPGEWYSFWKWMIKQYWLIYIWWTKKDVLWLRKKRKEKLYRYKLQFSPAEIQWWLKYFIKRSNWLLSSPEYYHVFTNNCVINLRNAFKLKWKNQPAFRFKIVWWSWVPEYLYKLGYLDTSKSFQDLKRRARYEVM